MILVWIGDKVITTQKISLDVDNFLSGYCICTQFLMIQTLSVSAEFEKKNDGEQCPTSRIKQERVCKKAADVLGLVWGDSWHGPGNEPGCFIANDGRSTVHFNTALSATGYNAKYAEICIKGENLQVLLATPMGYPLTVSLKLVKN